MQPSQVKFASGFDVEHQEFGKLIRMKLVQSGLQRRQLRLSSLDEQQNFGGGFHRALPAVDRGQAGKKIDASGEPPLDQSLSQTLRGLGAIDSGENDPRGFVGHGDGYRIFL